MKLSIQNQKRLLLFPFCLLLLGLFSLTNSEAATSVSLARDSRALVKIVVNSQDLIPAEQNAAKELASYLEKITDAKLEIVDEKDVPSGTPAIFVGQTRYAQEQITNLKNLGHEEAILRTTGKNLILTGGRPRGTLYAVYELLENVLGVRWYTAWTEKVPHHPTLNLSPLDRHIKPYFMYRDAYTYLTDERMYADHEAWMRYLAHNRATVHFDNTPLLESLGAESIFGGRVGGGHGFAPYLPSEKYFKEHPEYYSMREGKRVPSNGLDGNHACLTNPDVLKIILEGVREDIKKNPTALCFTVAVNDGGCKTICDCPECRRVARQYGATDEPRTDTGLLAWFVNQVADAVQQEYPDKYIRTLIYGPACELPKGIRFRDNVVVQLCTGPSADWAKFAKNLWIWQYTDESKRGYYVKPILWWVDEQLKLCHQLRSVNGMFQENEFIAGNDFLFYQFYEMNLWILFKLCQDPTRNLQDLIDDFVKGYYGKASPSVLAYLKLIQSRRALYPYRLFDFRSLKKSEELFDRAEAAVKDSAEELARVKDLRLPLDLTAMAMRNSIIDDYLKQKGNTLDRYPFSRVVLKGRLLSTLQATKHPFLCTKRPHYTIDDKANCKTTFEPVIPLLENYLQSLCEGKEYVSLPDQFKSLPPENVIDLTASVFGINPYSESATSKDLIKTDSEAADGVAYVRLSAKELPLPIGIWNNSGVTDPDFSKEQKDFLKLDQSGQYVDWPQICRTIKTTDIKGPGYHLYQGPRFQLRPATFFYATKTWEFGQSLSPLYRSDKPKEIWDVYLSVKFTGPAYPHGKAEDPDAVFIDRVVFVRVSEGRAK